MTEEEKMVWAATFSGIYANAPDPPLHAIRDGSEREWDEGNAVHAIEMAGSSVEMMRKMKQHIKDGFEGCGSTYPMYLEMIQ